MGTLMLLMFSVRFGWIFLITKESRFRLYEVEDRIRSGVREQLKRDARYIAKARSVMVTAAVASVQIRLGESTLVKWVWGLCAVISLVALWRSTTHSGVSRTDPAH